MDKILTFNGKIATGGVRWITRAGSTPSARTIAPYATRSQFMDTAFHQSSPFDKTQGTNNSSCPDCGGIMV